jgi:hypothetical protein
MCPKTPFGSSETVYPFLSYLFDPEDLYMCCIHYFLEISKFISFKGLSPYRIERRKKSQRDANAGEGGSRNPLPRRGPKRTVHRDFPRGRMSIDTEIEEEEEDSMETSDDELADAETYRMSLIPLSENSIEDDVESIESELRGQVEEEEQEGVVKGTLNPRSPIKAPFNPSPTIGRPHKLLSYHVTSYRGKGATKQVKKLQKIDPRSQ